MQKLHANESVLLGLPIARGRALQPRAVILIDNAGHRILKGLVQLHQVLDARFNYLLAPLVHLVLLVLNRVCTHYQLNCLSRDLLDLFRVEVLVIIVVLHV